MSRSRSIALPAVTLVVWTLAVGVIATPASSMARLADVIEAKGWVVPHVTRTRTADDRTIVTRIVARVGAVEQIVYEALPGDLAFGRPVVSRDGTRLAFSKVDDDGSRRHHAIYVINVDRTGMKRLLELTPPTIGATRGTVIGGPALAWSSDNRRLAVFGLKDGNAASAPLGSSPASPLATVDVATGKITEMLTVGRRAPGDGLLGVITSQAWSPDNRSLVYMDDDGHAIVLDTVTGARRDLGIGHEPTWSPSGDEIAVKMPRERGTDRGKRNDGDYHVVPVDRPGERRLLLENPRPAWQSVWRPDYMTLGYYGPALWSPDAKYLALRRAKGEAWDTYVLERRTGRVERLSDFFRGDSWGGTP